MNACKEKLEELKVVLRIEDLIFDCESADCAFNSNGECGFALLHGRRPIVTEKDGCTDFVVSL